MAKHCIIYSHGFGVHKDDRGLFTDIAKAMPGCEHVMFDYNAVDVAERTLTLTPLTDQVAHLQRAIAETKVTHPQATLDIVAHSQGCIIAAMAKSAAIRRVVLLTPPANLDASRLIRLFADRQGSDIQLGGISRLARADGSTTIVPAEYWQSLIGPDPIELYNELSQRTHMTVITAEHDEVLGDQKLEGLDSRTPIESIDSDHGFTSARPHVADRVRSILGA